MSVLAFYTQTAKLPLYFLIFNIHLMTDTEVLKITLSDYQSTMLADMGLQNLLTIHTDARYGQAEDIVEKLKGGEAVDVTLKKEGSTTFFRGLKSYKLKYTQPA